ncbi:MAG TPA: sugar ABC transporter permease [Acidimicrobiales bacterium]
MSTEAPAAGTTIAAGDRAAAVRAPKRRWRPGNVVIAALFLLPALVVLGALVVYPIVYTIARSFYDATGDSYVGVDNFREAWESDSTRRALRNNAIWVVFAPTVVTALGLMFAVLTERVRWATAFKLIVFMPMAISFLAAGVIFRLVYERDPDRGLANAVLTGIDDTFRDEGDLVGARPRDENALQPDGRALITPQPIAPGSSALLPLVGLRPGDVSGDPAVAPEPDPDAITGIVWLDFARGGGGEPGVIDPDEQGLSGVSVQAVVDGRVVDSASTGSDGTFTLDTDGQPAQVRITSSNFRESWTGVDWLGSTLVTPSIIGAYVWIWAGFAMVLIAAGLAAIPREALEAARVDGANEWQVFRHITAPLLSPVLLVVFVTLVINVLKVFDLVFVIPPTNTQDDANVIALEMWRVSFGGGRDHGLGSALAVILFALVVPAMVFNIRRFRRESM